MAELKATVKAGKDEVKAEVKAGAKVKVYALRPPFVDLITDTTISEKPIEVEMHPWLEAQIAAGHLAVA